MQRTETSFCFPESTLKSILTFLSFHIPTYEMHKHRVTRSLEEGFADLLECFNGQSHFPLPPKAIKGWNEDSKQPGTQRQGDQSLSSSDQQSETQAQGLKHDMEEASSFLWKESFSCESPLITCHWELAHNPLSLATCPQPPVTGNLPTIPHHWQLARNPPSLTTCPQSPGATEPSPSKMEVGTSVFRLYTP